VAPTLGMSVIFGECGLHSAALFTMGDHGNIETSTMLLGLPFACLCGAAVVRSRKAFAIVPFISAVWPVVFCATFLSSGFFMLSHTLPVVLMIGGAVGAGCITACVAWEVARLRNFVLILAVLCLGALAGLALSPWLNAYVPLFVNSVNPIDATRDAFAYGCAIWQAVVGGVLFWFSLPRKQARP
jgi:hypothetical protein